MLTFLYREINIIEKFLSFPCIVRIKPSGLNFHESLKKKINNSVYTSELLAVHVKNAFWSLDFFIWTL